MRRRGLGHGRLPRARAGGQDVSVLQPRPGGNPPVATPPPAARFPGGTVRGGRSS
ncbi:hypothetical protein C882_2254 [Caenispirillum salinarum AK4]|uniref:Uncharacterized protein n=1 Tax=Caenispirillum salinarum AK4 TaxID=1238182 RepID=K9GNH9_9PROT|nr:hypothetical protein C882_2254 [Caenispirillum salinarum AK4]